MRIVRWFDNLSIQRKLLASFSIPLLLMLSVSITVYNNTQSMVEDHRWVAHTDKAIARAQELLNMVVDMETGQRGYLITGSDVFLEPYERALKVWEAKIQVLSQQVNDNPSQINRLKVINALHQQWLEDAGEKEINQRRKVSEGVANIQSVVDLIQQGTGKAIIDRVRDEIDQFIAIEQGLIPVRIAKSQQSANKTSLVLIFGTLLSTLTSIIVALWSSSRVKQRINILLKATQQVSLGQLDQGVLALSSTQSLNGKDEVGQLTNGFRLMAMNLVKSDKKMRDYNERLREESRKAEAAAKAKTDFLSTMSHEIRTPMNGVLGISQIIANETQEASTKEYINVILDSGKHLMTILNDILDFSKVEENKLELEKGPFCLAQVITPVCSAMQPLVDEKNIQLIIENEVPDSIEFEGDCARLRQILFNVVGNAIKFTNEGHILIRTVLKQDKTRLLLSVKDTGVGIPLDKQDHIFNAFEQADTSTTRKFGGTGLGLAIVKKLVELMDGEITLESEEGIGTQFFIDLSIPWVEKEQVKIEGGTDEQKENNKASLRILLVEDNRVNAIVAKSFCEKLGHTVDLAGNGLIAIQKVQSSEYDLILMDNHMPEMNGVEATHFIRDNLAMKTLLFAYTADVFRQAHDHFIEAGADHVLTKPLQQQSFIDALDQFSSRLPMNNDKEPSKAENVIQLHRKSIETLRLTEEELTHSTIIEALKEDAEALVDLLETVVIDFEKSVDELIAFFIAADLKSLYSTLHTTKGMALNLDLNTLANQALEIEMLVKDKQLPEIEQLQKLINRLQVNVHQSQRLINQYGKKESECELVV